MKRLLREWVQALIRFYAIGRNVRVGARFHVGPGSRLWAPTSLVIEDDVYVGKRCTIEVDGRIGAGSMIANNVGIVGRRDHDMRQSGVTIRESRWAGNIGHEDLRSVAILAGDNWVGYGAVILAPVSIGRGAIIAAGSVVLHDVPPYAIVGGNPARTIGTRFTEQEILLHESGLQRQLGSGA